MHRTMKSNKINKSGFYDKLTTNELEAYAKQGDPEAQFKLGYRYRYGKKAKKNFAKAIEWYTKAAGQGHSHAQNNLGVCYKQGKGVKKDPTKAVEWCTKAANNNYPCQQNNDILLSST